METLNPKITIQNTDQPWWLVRMEHAVSDCEHIDVQLKVARLPIAVPEMQRQVLRQSIALMQRMLDGNPS